ncbi:MAG: DUF5522 domain-containing protein [Ilumatobacteraceae bacterium]
MAAAPTPPVRPDHVTAPLPSRFGPRHRGFDEAMQRHAAAVERGDPAYADPTTGLMVFTSAFLARRGYCCSSGCRHCPYDLGTGRPTGG